MNRSLAELQVRVSVLAHVSDELRKECIGIAREKSPSSASDLASFAACKYGFGGLDEIAVAKATRWLAVIRRDYGEEIFNEVARTLAAPKPTT